MRPCFIDPRDAKGFEDVLEIELTFTINGKRTKQALHVPISEDERAMINEYQKLPDFLAEEIYQVGKQQLAQFFSCINKQEPALDDTNTADM